MKSNILATSSVVSKNKIFVLIQNKDAEGLKAKLQKKENKESLDLSKCNLTSEDIIFLSTILKENTTITSINLKDVKIDLNGSKAIEELLESNPNIVTIGFTSTKVTNPEPINQRLRTNSNKAHEKRLAEEEAKRKAEEEDRKAEEEAEEARLAAEEAKRKIEEERTQTMLDSIDSLQNRVNQLEENLQKRNAENTDLQTQLNNLKGELNSATLKLQNGFDQQLGNLKTGFEGEVSKLQDTLLPQLTQLVTTNQSALERVNKLEENQLIINSGNNELKTQYDQKLSDLATEFQKKLDDLVLANQSLQTQLNNILNSRNDYGSVTDPLLSDNEHPYQKLEDNPEGKVPAIGCCFFDYCNIL